MRSTLVQSQAFRVERHTLLETGVVFLVVGALDASFMFTAMVLEGGLSLGGFVIAALLVALGVRFLAAARSMRPQDTLRDSSSPERWPRVATEARAAPTTLILLGALALLVSALGWGGWFPVGIPGGFSLAGGAFLAVRARSRQA